MDDACQLKDLEIDCEFSKSFQMKLGTQWSVAKKLSTARTFAFLSLSQLVAEFQGIGMTALSCADAFPGLGMAGISWKKHFKDNVKVTINSTDAETKKAIEENAKSNVSEDAVGISVVHEDPNTLLHSANRLNFVYLEAYGSCVKYLESACRVICHRGVLCIVSTDLSTLYNKCPGRVQRIYHGHTMKHEYVKELSVRLILANVARAASRWDHGISVLLSYVDEHCAVVLLRILKGAKHADKSLGMIKKVSHCRVCNYRCLVNEKLHYAPQPEISNCVCKENASENGNIVPPIVMLGPVYTGPIFECRFLLEMRRTLVEFDAKHPVVLLLYSMILESYCARSDGAEEELSKILRVEAKTEEAKGEAREPLCKKSKIENDLESVCARYSSTACPVFYYLAQTHTKKGFNPPKLQAVIKKLRCEGFQACRTVFDPRGVKTSASQKEFRRVLNEIATETPHPSLV